MPGTVSWQLNDTQAALCCGDLCASLDARSPGRGLYDLSVDGKTIEDSQFLGVEADADGAATMTDLYQRGGDLIVRYAQSAQRQFEMVVYWRAGCLQLGAACCPFVDLIVSVETRLLDARPLLIAKTRLPLAHERMLFRPAGYCIGRFADMGSSYVEVRNPDDILDTSLAAVYGGVELSTTLFGQPLEKGVILRSRLRGLFVPRKDDEPLAQAALREFAATPTPLTT